MGKTCAGGIYSNAFQNKDNTFVLENLVTDQGDDCKGAGAAIFCYLIRRSENEDGYRNPMKVFAPKGDEFLIDYSKSFGCTAPTGFGALLSNFVVLSCVDRNPPKCNQFSDRFFQADEYFGTQADGPMKVRKGPAELGR